MQGGSKRKKKRTRTQKGSALPRSTNEAESAHKSEGDHAGSRHDNRSSTSAKHGCAVRSEHGVGAGDVERRFGHDVGDGRIHLILIRSARLGGCIKCIPHADVDDLVDETQSIATGIDDVVATSFHPVGAEIDTKPGRAVAQADKVAGENQRIAGITARHVEGQIVQTEHWVRTTSHNREAEVQTIAELRVEGCRRVCNSTPRTETGDDDVARINVRTCDLIGRRIRVAIADVSQVA